jgi:hypothetical protein
MPTGNLMKCLIVILPFCSKRNAPSRPGRLDDDRQDRLSDPDLLQERTCRASRARPGNVDMGLVTGVARPKHLSGPHPSAIRHELPIEPVVSVDRNSVDCADVECDAGVVA